MTAIAAIGSTGGKWPEGTPAPTFRTLFVLGEDAIDDTLRPRLDLFGADVSRVHAIETVLDGDNQYRVFNIAKHLPLLEATIVEKAFDVLVIDPLTFIMPGADRNAEGDTRDALTPLVKLADRTNVAVMGIAHVGKPSGSQRTPAQRILGATAFHSMARVVWMTTNTGGRLMAVGPVKANLSTKPNAVLWQWEEDQPIAWQGASDSLLEALLDRGVSTTPREDAEGWLRERLAGGAEKSAVIESEGKDRGFSWATLRRAADVIGVKMYKAAGVGAPWYWMLPDGVPVLSSESKVIQVDFGAGSTSTDTGSPDDAPRNVLTPLDAEVSKLSNLPESNLLTNPCAEQVSGLAPVSENGAADTPLDVTKLAQLAHPPVLESEQVTPSGEEPS